MSAYHSNPFAHGCGGQVSVELCADDATVSVGAGNLAPDDTQLAGLLMSRARRLTADTQQTSWG